MRWLTHHDDERGAAAIIVAICIVLLFSMAAFVVDVGALYVERRELQNGADAAVLAIAQECVVDPDDCQDVADALAASYADGNAKDEAHGIDDLDVVVADDRSGYAQVRTATETADGGTSLFYTFATVMGFDQKTVLASARAEWGAPASMPSVPLVVDECEAGYAHAHPDEEVTFVFHNGNDGDDTPIQSDCGGENPGSDLPGGFGWLETVDGTCTADIDSSSDGTNTAQADPGAQPPSECSPADFPLGEEIALPVYSTAEYGGENGTYEIVGYLGFIVTGAALHNGGEWKAYGEVGEPCAKGAPAAGGDADGDDHGNSESCLTGHFTQYVTEVGELGGQDFGTTLIRLTNTEETEQSS